MRSKPLQLALFWMAALLAAQAGAQTTTTTYGPFSVTSTSGTQLSNVVYSINVVTDGLLRVEYTAAATHCSDVRMHFEVDGVERAVSAFLVPGVSSGFFDVGPVTPGAHVIALRAEGRVGGCNSGQLVGWGGTAQVTTQQGPPAEVPAPGLIATLIVFVLGALAFGPWAHRRGLRR